MMLPSQLLSQWILENEDIWQMDFQDPSGLYAFANDRRVIFWEYHIVRLWELGWIRADIIRSQNQVNLEGIELIDKDKDVVYYFSDSRLLEKSHPDFEVALRALEDLPPDLKLFFTLSSSLKVIETKDEFWRAKSSQKQAVVESTSKKRCIGFILVYSPYSPLLPGSFTPFVGRQVELQTLLDLVRDPSIRLVTLLGTGGIGKTRLAVETATRLHSQFQNGVYFVPLAHSPDRAALQAKITAEDPITFKLVYFRTQRYRIDPTPC